jgi:hypothetical protein
MRPSRLRTATLVLPALALQACALMWWREPEEPERLDLNRASVRALERLPGVTPSMAARIVAGRPYDDPHALVERGILTGRELDRIADLVVVPERDRRP